MIREWKLIAAPNDKNSDRYQLLLQCGMGDVFIIVKELGKVCSRPEKTKGDFNFTIYLSVVDGDVEAKLKKIAEENNISPLEKSSSFEETQDIPQDDSQTMENNPFLTEPGPPSMPNVKPVPVIDSDALSTDMGMQLFPSAMNSFSDSNALPGVSPEAAVAANMYPSGGMDSVFVDTSDEADPFSDYVTSTESQPIAPIPDYEKLKEEEQRRAQAAKQQSTRTMQQSARTMPQQATPPVAPPPPSPDISARAAAHAASISGRIPASALNNPQQNPGISGITPPAAPSAPATPPPPAAPAAPGAGGAKKPFSFGAKPAGFMPSARIRKHTDDKPAEKKVVVQEIKQDVAPEIKTVDLHTRWNIELPLIPTQNASSMISGSHNRFAHAAAMAVVETPGTIYNPLVIYGPASSGKTHFVNLIAEGLSNTFGFDNIFVTSGLRLTKGVDIAVRAGKIKQLDEFFAKYKALIIDDIHLMMLTDSNKQHISKWLNDFVKEGKQIVITTSLPVSALASIEDALNFQLSQGWSVELKQTSSQNYKTILSQIMGGMGISINEGDMADYFINRKVLMKDATSILYDVRKLEKFINLEETGMTQGELVEMLVGLREEAVEMPSEDDLEKAAAWKPATTDQWLKWGIFYPKGQEKTAYYAMFSLYNKAKELGMDMQWQQVFVKDYDPGNVTAAAFGMADFVATQNVNGVIVLAPNPGTEAADKEDDFRHFVLNMIHDMSLKTGWITFEKVKSHAVATKVLMDLIG